MFLKAILGIFGFILLIIMLFIGWVLIWNHILCNIPILREVLGLDEPKNKYNKRFTLEYKL